MVRRKSVPATPDEQTIDPTLASYQPLLHAFRWFNAQLFGGRLPATILTLRNYGQARGFYARKRWGTSSGELADEIAINPKFILSRSTRLVLSTLAHEMSHSLQCNFGSPSRAGYHNKEWGQIMKAIGLHPSDTGQPGGRETGQRVSHYIVEGGQFDVACAALIDSGLTLRWGDIRVEEERKPDSKVKFSCPSCGANIWGKPATHQACLDCSITLPGSRVAVMVHSASIIKDEVREAA